MDYYIKKIKICKFFNDNFKNLFFLVNKKNYLSNRRFLIIFEKIVKKRKKNFNNLNHILSEKKNICFIKNYRISLKIF